MRAVCDALTAAGVWRDDAPVVSLTASKACAGGVADHGVHGVPRATIEVACVPPWIICGGSGPVVPRSFEG